MLQLHLSYFPLISLNEHLTYYPLLWAVKHIIAMTEANIPANTLTGDHEVQTR
jgi:hypothetical protein